VAKPALETCHICSPHLGGDRANKAFPFQGHIAFKNCFTLEIKREQILAESASRNRAYGCIEWCNAKGGFRLGDFLRLAAGLARSRRRCCKIIGQDGMGRKTLAAARAAFEARMSAPAVEIVELPRPQPASEVAPPAIAAERVEGCLLWAMGLDVSERGGLGGPKGFGSGAPSVAVERPALHLVSEVSTPDTDTAARARVGVATEGAAIAEVDRKATGAEITAPSLRLIVTGALAALVTAVLGWLALLTDAEEKFRIALRDWLKIEARGGTHEDHCRQTGQLLATFLDWKDRALALIAARLKASAFDFDALDRRIAALT
jgi:hypothetical protein